MLVCNVNENDDVIGFSTIGNRCDRCFQVQRPVWTSEWWPLVALNRWPLARGYLKNKIAPYTGKAAVIDRWPLA